VERSLPIVVVFDLGGVLVPGEGSFDDLAAEFGADREDLTRAYWRARDDYDRGGPSATFWGSVNGELGRGLAADQLDAVDAARWSSPAPGVVPLLAELRASGARLAVLSNAPAAVAAAVRTALWSAVFEELLFSCDVGALKPEPAIYRELQHRLAVPADQLLFFDDRPVNVAGAQEQGWDARVWTTLHGGRADLVTTGLLGSSASQGGAAHA